MFRSSAYQVPTAFNDCGLLAEYASSLVGIATELFATGEFDNSISMFDTAHRLLTVPSVEVCALAASQLRLGSHRLIHGTCINSLESHQHDLYQEDECDVGPRPLKTLVRVTVPLSFNTSLMEAVIFFNKAVVFQSQDNIIQASQHYGILTATVQTLLKTLGPSNNVIEMGMRSHNNLGQIYYMGGNEVAARRHFEAALLFACQLCDQSQQYRLEYATVLSNLCRAQWMIGDIGDSLYQGLLEVLQIRSSLLRTDHVDVAAAHFNLGVAEYTRRRGEKAISHLRQYLNVALLQKNSLDPIPAHVYILLVQHEDVDDNISNELVRGLRTLQEKRQDIGPQNAEVASVLNFIGTILFHIKDFENALVFFEEELRIEECLFDSQDDISISVTCNNIGRILQELGKYHDAVCYYRRALRAEYGDIGNGWLCKDFKSCPLPKSSCTKSKTSATNLYSTVWYNLGLIYDKLANYADAIRAFQMSLDLRKSMLGRNHPDIACLLYNIGVLQMEQQQLNEATISFREALRIRRVCSTGQLNDHHVVKTLEKLASLHRARGNIDGALEALREILRIQENGSDYASNTGVQNMGITLHLVAELHHAIGDLDAALRIAQESVSSLELAANSCSFENRLNCIEHLVSSYLLVGSIYHEICEDEEALRVFSQALSFLNQSRSGQLVPPSLHALYEVTRMLATKQCAPEA